MEFYIISYDFYFIKWKLGLKYKYSNGELEDL